MTPRQWIFYIESVPFTADAILGQTSLGGSESAAIGTMNALRQRGHDVQCFATQLQEPGEYAGVMWHHADTLPSALSYLTPDVFVALRMPSPFVNMTIPSCLNVLWCEDMMTDPNIVSTLPQVDQLWYVSQYHQQQWEGREALLKGHGWITKNGIDPALYPAMVSPTTSLWADGVEVTRERHRYIYISRPERALAPLLAMWPKIRKRDPEAVLGICRYRSMYDGEGSNVQRMVDRFDAMTEQVAQQVGGIEWLGQLGKRQLAEAIARSRAMLYPGVADFAETSCIAAIEAQACGTPLVGSWRGALPETLHPLAGVLLDGDPVEPGYQDAFCGVVEGIADMTDERYAKRQQAGRAHVLPGYTFDRIAEEWEQHIEATFAARYAANGPAILKNLLHYDRHVMGLTVAAEIGDDGALKLCDRVCAGDDQTAADYATFAIQDPLEEAKGNHRFGGIVESAKASGVTAPASILDVACGNGSLALVLATAFPGAHVRGVDYSGGVLALAEKAAKTLGVAGRVTFSQAGWQDIPEGPFDLVTCGEFIEHVVDPAALINRLEQACADTGVCVFTCPAGPFVELMDDPETRKRGHLHTYTYQQISALMVDRKFTIRHLPLGVTRRGMPIGYWIVSWLPNRDVPAKPLDWRADIVATRPYRTLTAMMIVKDGEDWLRKCLKSVKGVVDDVLIHDTGSTDGSVALAASLGAIVRQMDWPESFGAARNRVLREAEDRGADWVLWIDCDETLENAASLRRYIAADTPFNGYVIRQQHLMLDAPSFHDKPVRLFRTGNGVRFYGAIHEQPETAPDAGIWPALEIQDMDILHLGYHRDKERRRKLLTRNLPLLEKQLRAPEGERRRLDLVLYIRDCANIAQFELEAHNGRRTKKALDHAEAGAGVYRAQLADAADKYHDLARPFYDICLAALGRGFEVGYAIAGGAPKLNGKLQPASFRAWDVDEAKRELAAKADSIFAPMVGTPLQTLPSVLRIGHRLVDCL